MSYAEPARFDLPCTIPSGLYSIHHLGAGHDTLHLAITTQGDVRGAYRVLESSSGAHYPAIYEVWLDNRSARISCHGDSLEISSGALGRSVSLALVWNRELSKLYATGTYTGRLEFKKALFRGVHIGATLLTLGYSALYVMASWDDFAYRYRNRVGLYLLNEALFRLTIPALAGGVGMATLPFMKFSSSYSLYGFGVKDVAASKKRVCEIPPGYYHGSLNIPDKGIVEVTIPVGVDRYKDPPKVVVTADSFVETYTLAPSVYSCQGNELIVEWDSSLPDSKGYIATYYQEGKGLTGIGYFSGSVWLSRLHGVMLPMINLLKDS
ncbi:hypothetical protein [Sansalvadorimonas verongulae]|uniref:hypothetical protein n=1 Tax=Sansalvadorimonas verongulae TaxID=2172824 RepID=UPI0012BBC294|nr:hypothetical protein [Sansalvadorimonas verongulae]MTI15508.1 hypothetical protein [Sansalvadorimonas verongulae]